MNFLLPLESRTLFAAVPTSVTVANGTLTVMGTKRPDSIFVAWGSPDGSTVLVTTTTGQNSQTYTFPTSSIQSIHVEGGNGRDTINVAPMTFSSTLIGGRGNDTITGSLAGDHIDGGHGHDFIQTTGGTNNVLPGPGNDRLKIAQADIYTGSRGKDRILD